jgi:uncharacterized membrane protein
MPGYFGRARGTESVRSDSDNSRAFDELWERYTRGEISWEKYERLSRDLEE